MSGQQSQFDGGKGVLYRRAVRTPLPDVEAERAFHRNMMDVAEGMERKAEMLADPEVPLLAAYERELERIAAAYERRVRHITGGDYEAVVHAYQKGERTDRVAELAAYYYEGIWRMQRRITVSDMLFCPVILRYPDSFTVNIRFASGFATPTSVRYESPEHCTEDLDEASAETYCEESSYSQRQAATYIRERADVIREEFPDPDETAFEERKFGGIVSGGGRKGSTFSSMLERVDPDPDRFSEPAERPALVPEGTEARRTEDELLLDGEVIA